MNSAAWDLVLKVFFAKFRTCESREQCTGPTIFQQNAETHVQRAFQMHTEWRALVCVKFEEESLKELESDTVNEIYKRMRKNIA